MALPSVVRMHRVPTCRCLTSQIHGPQKNHAKNKRPSSPLPDPWADLKRRSTSGFHKLHRRSTRVQNWGSTFWILPVVWALVYRGKRPMHLILGSLDRTLGPLGQNLLERTSIGIPQAAVRYMPSCRALASSSRPRVHLSEADMRL